MAEDSDFDEEIRKEFIEESLILLDQCEESFMNLSESGHRVKELEKIFRLAHSIKGAAAALGFTELAAFTHVVEDCLSILKTKPEFINTYIISMLLRSSDEIKKHLHMIRAQDKSPWLIEDLKSEVAECNQRLSADPQSFAIETSDDNSLVFLTESAAHKNDLGESHENPQFVNEHVEGDLKSKNSKDLSPAAGILAKSGSVSIRVDADRIDKVLNISGELLVLKSQLENHCKIYADDVRLKYLLSLVEKSISEMYDRTLGMRMMPLKNLFLKTQRAVWDLSLKLDKPIDIYMSGEGTEIDRTMVDILVDPLMHIARNSLDHGIENSTVRTELGKNPKGKINLSAFHEGGRVILKIEDDGGGINRDRVIKKAKEKGLLAETVDAASLSDKQVFDFLFAPGFSTAEKVTDISGRGVGMDVVKTNIEKIKGTIEIFSKETEGTSLMISLPLTTAITEGMIFKIGSELYILPMECILQLFKVAQTDIVRLGPQHEIIKYRGEIFSYFKLEEYYEKLKSKDQVESKNSDSDNVGSDPVRVVLIQAGHRTVALRIEAVLGQIEAVLKPLGDKNITANGISGAAVLGDGRLALVLDPIGLDRLFSLNEKTELEYGA